MNKAKCKILNAGQGNSALGLTTLEGHGPVGEGLEEGHKDDLKYFSSEDRLKELGLLSLEKGRLWGETLQHPSSHYKTAEEQFTMIGQGIMASS